MPNWVSTSAPVTPLRCLYSLSPTSSLRSQAILYWERLGQRTGCHSCVFLGELWYLGLGSLRNGRYIILLRRDIIVMLIVSIGYRYLQITAWSFRSWYSTPPLQIHRQALTCVGFFPGCVFLISCWYTRYEVQKRLAAFYAINIFANAFGSILAYGIMQLNGKHGYLGWRWFILPNPTLSGHFLIIKIGFSSSTAQWQSS